MSWLAAVLTVVLPAVLLLVVALFAAVPTAYSHFQLQYLTEGTFRECGQKQPKASGYAHFQKYKNVDGRLRVDASVQIVVLGDIGRSPRMQYHALSLASHGATVDIIGYAGKDYHPDILQSPLIKILPIQPFPYQEAMKGRVMFLLLAPIKILYQIWQLFSLLAYKTAATRWMLIQNPPSIPTLAICQIVCFLRNTRLVIDWHNFGYTILALRLGQNHPVVKLAKSYEGFFSARGVYAHFTVTNAMAKRLSQLWGIQNALPLHDRPAPIYQPLTPEKRAQVLQKIPGTSPHAEEVLKGNCALIVSSTSWTADEDFSILLDALVQYSASAAHQDNLPNLIAIITGKGPQRDYYLAQISALTQAEKLQHVLVTTAWLSAEDYAGLLGAADLGVSLHTSSSGVDLPMKVVDMFGAGLPVAGWDAFEAWPELVQEGKNGRGFDSAEKLCDILTELFGTDVPQLERLRAGAMKECRRRWDDEWMPVAGKLFQLKL